MNSPQTVSDTFCNIISQDTATGTKAVKNNLGYICSPWYLLYEESGMNYGGK